MLTAYIQGIGLIGPGLADWQTGARVLAGEGAYSPQSTELPVLEGLPPAERRRTGDTVRLGLGVAQQAVAAAGVDPTTLIAVFSSSNGDGAICHEICETLASADRQLSPTRFHNSVHNAAAGYWSLATGATTASTALCAYDVSFAAGLLEALVFVSVDRAPVLLSAYETPYPQPLQAKRPLPDSFGVALILTPTATPASRAQLAVSLSAVSLSGAATAADRLAEPQLEALRKGDTRRPQSAAVAASRPPPAGRGSARLCRRATHGHRGERVSLGATPFNRLPGGTRLDREWIESHIPHQGRMCLLDEVLSWDAVRIRCRAASHRLPDNPLRAHGRLGAACGVEYAAQAMAVHGAIMAQTAGNATRGGLLTSVRNLALLVHRLDDLETDLIASAERLAGNEGSTLYEFTVSSAGRELLSGRIGIVFQAERES